MSKKMGIIGYGGMAFYHGENISTFKVGNTEEKLSSYLEVKGVYDINPDRMKMAQEKGFFAYESLEALLGDKEIDIVLVATPNNFHCEMACAAMNAGKNVVCEKPVAMSLEELDLMIETSKKNNVLFTVHQNRRWDHDYRIVRNAIEKGMIGKPYTIESRVHGKWGVMHGWRAYKVAGGGMLFDWGVHMIDQILDMYPDKKVKSVFCVQNSVKTPEVDDYFKLIMCLEDNINVLIEVGTYQLYDLQRWYVCGDLGSITVPSWENGTVIQAKSGEMVWEPEVIQTKAGPTRTMAPRPQESMEENPLPGLELYWTDFYVNVCNAIDGKEEQIVKHHQIRRVLSVIMAGFKSAETGEAVALES